MEITRPPYSYLDDPEVPTFDALRHLAVMDAQCALCARGARWIARHDRREEFRILPIQTPLGAALLRHYGMDPDDPNSWLYLTEGRAYSSLDATIRVAQHFGGLWRPARCKTGSMPASPATAIASWAAPTCAPCPIPPCANG